MPEKPQFERTILITGATDGFGKQTACDLASHPSNFVIIHGYTEEKCEATRDYIIKETNNPNNIEYVVADFSGLKQINEMAKEIETKFPDLNIILCNASVLNTRRMETKDGHEETIQINYLAHFLLCNRLIDTLAKNKNARIYMIGSMLHGWTALDWQDMMATKEYEKYLQFSRTKLMCHLMAFALHRRMVLSKRDVSINVIEVGKEKEPNNNGKIRSTATTLSSSMSTLSMCRTSSNLVQLLENDTFLKMSGKYMDVNGKQLRSGSEATDERLQERLWKYSTELCAGYF
ncbi:unnamed protein product [Auanema sp. JU1783]|nr:unnamed protein product [Auanema sp. JU1783]